GNAVEPLRCQHARFWGVATSPPLSTGMNPSAIAVADVDKDGKLDVMVTESGANANTMSILFGNGDATLHPRVSYNTGTHPDGVAIADLDKDGSPDIVVANRDQNSVTVFYYKGDRMFQPMSPLTTPGSPTSVATADMDGDGRVDIVVSESNG